MKRYFVIFCLFWFCSAAFAFCGADLAEEQKIQNHVNEVGMRILNANKIDAHIVFLYDKNEKKLKLPIGGAIPKRKVVLFDSAYKFTENDDELAAFLSREIFLSAKSFEGKFNGVLSSLQVGAAPKKYEIVADKRAVDFMVTAGFHPVGLITFIQKTSPQKRFDRFSNKNLTSKRLAVIYEYIFTKYPYFLVNNKYFDNDNYQNFLLNSQNNRRLLLEKIKANSREKLKYE